MTGVVGNEAVVVPLVTVPTVVGVVGMGDTETGTELAGTVGTGVSVVTGISVVETA